MTHALRGLLSGILLMGLSACQHGGDSGSPQGTRGPAYLFVGPGGSDTASGDASHPLATLQGARDAVRRLKAQGGLPLGGVIIQVGAGVYDLAGTLILGPGDSGAPGSPIVYQALPGASVHLRGGRTLPASAFHAVTDAAVLARLAPAVAGQVLQVDLGTLGITESGTRRLHGFWHPLMPSAAELYLDGKALTLARWPDAGEVPMAGIVDPGSTPRTGDTTNRGGTFTYSGDRPLGWQQPAEAWVTGYFHYSWADDSIRIASVDTVNRSITLSDPHLYGLTSGQPYLGYHVENVLEELDQPGEWYLDAAHGQLYLLPPFPLAGHELTLSMLEGPLVSLQGASNVTLRGMTLECGRGMGVYIDHGSHNRIERCTLRDFGTVGVSIGQGILGSETVHYESTGTPWQGQVGDLISHLYTNSAWDFDAGTDNGVVACELSELGGGGIVLGGGDRKALIPGGNFADGNDIHDVNRLSISNRPAIFVHGAGARVTHNRIHAIPEMAIYLQGNDHLVAYNEIFDANTIGRDMGAVYVGRDPSERGDVIQWNYFHEVGNPTETSTNAIYLDDGNCGYTVQGNVFYHCGGSVQGAVFVHAGNQNAVTNNIFIESPLCVGLAMWTDTYWLSHFGPGTIWERRLLFAVDIQAPPYTTRYPAIVGFYGAPQQPATNTVDKNLAVNCPSLNNGQAGWCTLGTNWQTTTDPGFVDAAHQNWALKPDAAVYQQIPGFQPIPFQEIGPGATPGAPVP
ncbi:MAG TPA: right-handed parallel beta-helix repeat-containing protein [Holophagaceae bacterium]|nr:right-handed parallel beta-helix repeat-containing protein [Holophagaceae bacterium]